MDRNCKVTDCNGDPYFGGFGYCSKHYYRLRRHGDPNYLRKVSPHMSDDERFSFIGYDIVDDCWKWRGTVGAGGYGVIKTSLGVEKAHRLSYRIHFGEIPKGEHVLHSCDNPICVNPSHLRVGSRSDNMQEMWDKKRHPKTARKLDSETEKRVAQRYWETRKPMLVAEEFGISRSLVYSCVYRVGRSEFDSDSESNYNRSSSREEFGL